ncbi:hypothetical protein P3T27_003406 [Kitasatospora sp. MAA19]|uniref:hypothetical protein n=1 Tax=Kitasatospora sp. MAA19 TaxID=3035090 RepID=UPI002473AA96|nr:hypothetical protein [Kitasatospora sp. MAA19]MDH6706679.1 hypothetical protein [Kitasatospora sp. MAA19]
MKHSILDGVPADTFPASDSARPPGRTRVGDCMSRPGIAVTPGTDFATVAAVLGASRRGIVPVVTADGTVTGVVASSAAPWTAWSPSTPASTGPRTTPALGSNTPAPTARRRRRSS